MFEKCRESVAAAAVLLLFILLSIPIRVAIRVPCRAGQRLRCRAERGLPVAAIVAGRHEGAKRQTVQKQSTAGCLQHGF